MRAILGDLLGLTVSTGMVCKTERHAAEAERAQRHGVIWRKTSYGTDGAAGSRFVERRLTVVATCRQRGRAILDFLTACLRSRLDGTPAPSLMA